MAGAPQVPYYQHPPPPLLRQGFVTEWVPDRQVMPTVKLLSSCELSHHVGGHQRTGPGVGKGRDQSAVVLLIHIDRASLSGDQHINHAVLSPRPVSMLSP